MLSTHLAITTPISSSESIKPYFLKIKDNRNFRIEKNLFLKFKGQDLGIGFVSYSKIWGGSLLLY